MIWQPQLSGLNSMNFSLKRNLNNLKNFFFFTFFPCETFLAKKTCCLEIKWSFGSQTFYWGNETFLFNFFRKSFLLLHTRWFCIFFSTNTMYDNNIVSQELIALSITFHFTATFNNFECNTSWGQVTLFSFVKGFSHKRHKSDFFDAWLF